VWQVASRNAGRRRDTLVCHGIRSGTPRARIGGSGRERMAARAWAGERDRRGGAPKAGRGGRGTDVAGDGLASRGQRGLSWRVGSGPLVGDNPPAGRDRRCGRAGGPDHRAARAGDGARRAGLELTRRGAEGWCALGRVRGKGRSRGRAGTSSITRRTSACTGVLAADVCSSISLRGGSHPVMLDVRR
jgi:hypothetical protein